LAFRLREAEAFLETALRTLAAAVLLLVDFFLRVAPNPELMTAKQLRAQKKRATKLQRILFLTADIVSAANAASGTEDRRIDFNSL
jgi:hypothetical protein